MTISSACTPSGVVNTRRIGLPEAIQRGDGDAIVARQARIDEDQTLGVGELDCQLGGDAGADFDAHVGLSTQRRASWVGVFAERQAELVSAPVGDDRTKRIVAAQLVANPEHQNATRLPESRSSQEIPRAI